MQPDPNTPFASVINLGAFKSDHSPSKRNRWINVIFSGLFLAAGPVLLLVALYLAYDAYNRYGISRVDDSGFWLPLVCGGLAIPLGLYGLFSAWRNWPLTLTWPGVCRTVSPLPKAAMRSRAPNPPPIRCSPAK